MLSLQTEQPKSYNLKTKIVAAVAATATIGVIAAVGLSQTTTARQTTGLFNIPEDIKGHFSGGQRNGDWTAQGKFHKFETSTGDWQIDVLATVGGRNYLTDHVFTYINNVLTEETVANGKRIELECGDRDSVPGYGKWAGLLDGAKAVSRSEMSEAFAEKVDASCPEGAEAVLLQFEGKTWTVCADSVADTRAMYVFDDVFQFQAVARPGMTVDIAFPEGADSLNCSQFDPTVDLNEWTAAYQAHAFAGSVGVVPDELQDDEEEQEMDDDRQLYDDKMSGDDTGTKNTGNGWDRDPTYPVPEGLEHPDSYYNTGRGDYLRVPEFHPDSETIYCLWYHGVGGRGAYGPNSITKGLRTHGATDYWGENMGQGVGRKCDHIAVYDGDTFHRGYGNWQYNNEICVSSARYNKFGTKAILFAHSMGGLATRKTFQRDGCGWKGKYYTSQSPMGGSDAAKAARGACIAIKVTVLIIATLLVAAAILSGAIVVGGPIIVKALAAWICGGSAGVLLTIVGFAGNVLRPYCMFGGFGKSGQGFKSIYAGLPNFSTSPYNQLTGRHARANGRLCGYSPKGMNRGGSTALKLIQWSANLQKTRICKTIKNPSSDFDLLGGWYHSALANNNANNWLSPYYLLNSASCRTKQIPWNDGMVPIWSCQAWDSASPASIKYMNLNHGDGTGREGTRWYTGADIFHWYNSRQN